MKRQKNSRFFKQLPVVIILMQLSWCPLWGLDPGKPVEQYLVDQWEIADGIPSNEIHAIAQTPDGYLWIAASKGLVRFDGIRFFTILFAKRAKIHAPKTIVLDTLFTDNEGILWIGSSGGLTSYDYQTDRFKTFTGSRIRRIMEDMKGNLWISSWDDYVSRFSNGKFTLFNATHGLEGKRINAIAEDKKGNLLFATRENGVFEYREGKFSRYPIEGLGGYHIIFMHEDRQGELWIGTTNGLFRVTGERTSRYTAAHGLPGNYITYILEDSEHNLWIGTLKGLARLKKKQNGEASFEHVLKNLKITCLFEDREKSLWIGTLNSGIKRLKESTFISYAPIEALPGEILFSMYEDRQGDMWIGTVNGKLYRFRENRRIETLEPPELAGTGITAMEQDADGNPWLGTNGKGVFQEKNGTFIQYTTREGLADNMVTSIYRDTRGHLWFGTVDGVSVFRYPDGVIESFTSRDGLSGKTVHSVCEDKDRNIRVAADKGLTVLENGNIIKPGIKVYLEGISVTCVYEDPSPPAGSGGVYWIATHGAGLQRLQGKDAAVTSYTVACGMGSNSLFRFFEDRQGYSWLMSDSGILRVSKAELNRLAGGQTDSINCISYGTADGMKSSEFNNRLSPNSALQTGNGELWFLTRKGISIVNPGKIQIDKTTPPVVIEKVFFDGQAMPLRQEPGANRFKSIRNLRFHFTAPTFLAPGKIKFRYRLIGFDNDWIFLPPGRGRVAHYWDLDPGGYTFRVIASNADGIWNRTGAAISFTIESFFYQTLLFKIAALLLLAALIAAAVFIYKKRPFEKKKKKYEGSSLNRHFAGECIKKLRHLMEVETLYRDEDITLQSLAEKLSIKPYQLSQVLNEKLNRGFSDYINYYRIGETKEKLRGPAGARRKITALAREVGFNSMTAFYKAFRKYVGMTPKQYKEEEKKKK